MMFSTKQVGFFLLLLSPLAMGDASSIRGGDGRVLSVEDLESTPPPTMHLVTLTDSCSEDEFSEVIAAENGTVVFYHEATAIAVVQGLEDESAVAGALESECIKTIDEDVAIPFNEDPPGEPSAETSAGTENADDPASAILFDWQWNMGIINANVAWDAGRLGSKDITVAVLDSGIDYENPDLIGLVDLDKSASFVPWDDYVLSFYAGWYPSQFGDKHPITDLGFHGTHVANTIASNARALAAVTSKTTLIGVKVCSYHDDIACPFSSIIAGLLHSVDVGADVINMSLGGSFLKEGGGGGAFAGYLNRLLNYVNRNKAVVVVSAGNSQEDLDHDGSSYKAFCSSPNAICVSATTINDEPASYTNYGNSAINVGAPGGDSDGKVWAACSQTSIVIPDCQSGWFVLPLSGTSMAAPHVSGLAALVVEDVGNNPGRVKTIIQNSADDLGDRGNDPYFGKGRINVAAALGL